MTDPPTPLAQRLDQTAAWPYTRGEYVKRKMWDITHALLLRHSFARCAGWRRFWCRRFGMTLGQQALIRPCADITHPWLLTLGDYSCIGDRVRVYNLGPITIGDHTVISQDATLCAGTHDHTDPTLPLERPEIRIGSGVWVCAEAFIGPGVTVHDNAVVGARAVVTRDVPAGMIVAGNPAQIIGPRIEPADANAPAPDATPGHGS